MAVAEGLSPTLQKRLLEAGEGLSNPEIADANVVSINTVKKEIQTLLKKMRLKHTHDIADAVNAARAHARAGASMEQIYDYLRLRFE